MKHFQINSVRFKLVAFVLLIFVLLTALIAINNVIAKKDVQNKIYDTMKETITMYQNRLSDGFDIVDNYLTNFAYDDMDIRILSSDYTSSTQWYSSLYHIQKSFRSALPIYDMDGFFLYTLKEGTYFTETNTNVSYDKSRDFKNTLIPLLQDGVFLEKNNKNKWIPLKIADNYYLFRVIRIHSCYIGTWISTSAALQPLVGKEMNESVFFADGSGSVLDNNMPVKSIQVPKITNQKHYQYEEIENIKNLIVSCKVDFADAYIITLIPEDQFFMDSNRYTPLLVTAILAVSALMVLAAIIINHLVIKPLTRLNAAISSLKNGNLDTVVSTKKVSTEFGEVYNAFNEMVREIEALKIDVYEEKLSRQHIHTQYLKLQITPHFLINCLSMAYQLAEINKPDLMKIMLKDLSQHLRYTLSSGETVSLKQELMHVKNYIELSKIRYPNGIALFTDCIPEAMNATVIPLLIQNFIENTIKYEVVMGKTIEIHISITVTKREERDNLVITIWDTGCGFSENILNQIQDIRQYVKDTRLKHIGISNVLQRACLIFGEENCNFYFSNRPDAGAQIKLNIPFVPFFIKEEVI